MKQLLLALLCVFIGFLLHDKITCTPRISNYKIAYDKLVIADQMLRTTRDIYIIENGEKELLINEMMFYIKNKFTKASGYNFRCLIGLKHDDYLNNNVDNMKVFCISNDNQNKLSAYSIENDTVIRLDALPDEYIYFSW